MSKKIKIFGVPWHISHQYSLAQIPNTEWYWLINFKRKYNSRVRGEFMINWVPYYEPGKYDLAILHIDQQCVDKNIWEIGKGSVYRELNEVIKDIPKIVINHGTPYYPEVFDTMGEIVEKVKKIIGKNTMVVNSRRAAEQWGFGVPIIHGLDPNEWLDLPKEPRVITVLAPAGLDKYYDRSFLEATRDLLAEEGIIHCHVTIDWISNDFDDYREFLGRSLIYFNPTRESPMPRSRTEAMLSGCCVITTPSQDADSFIKHGINGYIVKRNPKHAVQLIKHCMYNYEETVAIGQCGKETAIQTFSKQRYEQEWTDLINKTIKKWYQIWK